MEVYFTCIDQTIIRIEEQIDRAADNIALAICRGDEYFLIILFATQLRFRQTNNARHRIPPHRQPFNIVRHFIFTTYTF